MDWNDVRHFLALARTGSVRAAGASLGVSHSTIARRVEALEAELSVRLFDRSRGGYTLTDAGEQMVPGAERVEREMSALERGIVGQDRRLEGVVSITCCDSYVSDVLIRDLTPFCAEFPGIELMLTTDSRPFDLAKREADMALRILGVGDQPPEFLIGRTVAPVVMASYVAVAHAGRLDPEVGAADARWLSIEQRSFHETLVAESSYPHLPVWGSFSSLELLVQACREGLGLAMLPTYVGDREVELRQLAQPDLRHLANLWLLSHPDLRDNARLRATRARIGAAFDRQGALFSGEDGS